MGRWREEGGTGRVGNGSTLLPGISIQLYSNRCECRERFFQSCM